MIDEDEGHLHDATREEFGFGYVSYGTFRCWRKGCVWPDSDTGQHWLLRLLGEAGKGYASLMDSRRMET